MKTDSTKQSHLFAQYHRASKQQSWNSNSSETRSFHCKILPSFEKPMKPMVNSTFDGNF